MFEVVLVVLCLIWMIFAVVQDWKCKEIANWLNISLLIFALGFRFFYSLFNESFSYLYQGLIGFAIFFVLGELFYHGRMFAGGDKKLMSSLGAILPFSTSLAVNSQIFIWFISFFLLIALLYTLGASVYYTLRNPKKFKKKFLENFKHFRGLIIISMFLGILLFIISFFTSSETSLFFGIILFILPLLYIYTKAVDDSSMIARVSTKNLVEGDWLYKDVKVGKKEIKASWGGLEKRDIALLRKNKKFVRIRDGIAFSPVFLISFILTVIVYYIRII